jgi:hypothetical protein
MNTIVAFLCGGVLGVFLGFLIAAIIVASGGGGS